MERIYTSRQRASRSLAAINVGLTKLDNDNAPLLATVPRRTFVVNYRYSRAITGAALAAPCANTHSINMGQRVIKLLVGLARAKQHYKGRITLGMAGRS